MAQEFDEEEVPEEQLALLNRLCDKLAEAKALIDQKERELNDAQEGYRRLRENDIPELMLSVGLTELTMKNGVRVELREEVRVGLPKSEPARTNALKWLHDEGHGGLVKTEISVKLNREQLREAAELWSMMERYQSERGVVLDTKKKEDVNYQTLNAFFRAEIRSGNEVPLELFGGFIQKFAEIKVKKERG